jgi:hypothetical protein
MKVILGANGRWYKVEENPRHHTGELNFSILVDAASYRLSFGHYGTSTIAYDVRVGREKLKEIRRIITRALKDGP